MTIATYNPQVDSQTPSIMPGQAGVIPLSLSLRRLIAEQFTPDTLRQLASLMEAQKPGTAARRRLSEASIDELAEMLTTGRKPTVGWWRRHAA
jgi:hypothetical protein